MVEELRILCEECIGQYAFKKRDDVLPAMVVNQGRSLCWEHYVEFAKLKDKIEVKVDKTTYPPSYAITRLIKQI